MQKILIILILLLPVQIIIAFPGISAQLIMIDQEGCEWCELWDEEIAGIYPKTDEGKKIPLVRYDIQDVPNDNFVFKRDIRYTPTFIVVNKGKEVGRIEGYPGESFFWPMLGLILNKIE